MAGLFTFDPQMWISIVSVALSILNVYGVKLLPLEVIILNGRSDFPLAFKGQGRGWWPGPERPACSCSPEIFKASDYSPAESAESYRNWLSLTNLFVYDLISSSLFIE